MELPDRDSAAAAATGLAPLRADRHQLARFVDALFRYADEGTFVSFRSFTHAAGERPFAIRAAKVNGSADRIVHTAERMASEAGRAPEPTVFAPPIATFTNPSHAAEADLANGLALSVECDSKPAEARARLEGLLGPVTVAVASGGLWADPATGEVQEKLHLHWRLSEPTRTPADHANLKLLRKLAALLVGGDPTATPLVHPLRWPGSWHRKGEPKLCRMVTVDEARELHLGEALATLEGAAKAAGLSLDTIKGSSGSEDRHTAELIRLVTTGTEYLSPLVALSARYAGRGMSVKQIEATLRGFMEAVPEGSRDLKNGTRVPGRWADRVKNLGRMARSGVAKYAPEPAAPLMEQKEDQKPAIQLHVIAAEASTAGEHRERSDTGNAAHPWPKPDLSLLETRRTPPPLFPLDVLGTWAGWVRDHAEVASAPVDYVAWSLLGCIGAMVANSLWTSPWPGWREPPVLFVGCVGLPSSSKSPAIDTIFSPVRAAEKELGKDFPERHREWELARAVAELRLKEWKAGVKTALEAGEPPPDKPDDAEVPPEPKRPRLFTTDATMEAAALLAQQEPKGLQLIRDELAGWVGGLDKYGGDGAERAFWIEAYGGRAKVVDRVKFDGKELFVPHLSIAILGGIQPDRLASMIIGGDDDGLAARFVLVWPEPVPLRRPRAMPDPDQLAEALFRLRKLQPADWDQKQEPVAIRFTEAAAEALHSFRLEVREIEAAASGQFLSHVGKWPGLAARLALILELLWWAGQQVPPPGGPSQVGERAAVAAIGLVAEYVGPMARRVYGEAALPQAEQDAAALARRLVRLDPMPETVNARELRRQRFLSTSEPDRYTVALAELEDAGWCRPAEASRPGPGRRPKDWLLNPALRRLA